MFSHSFSNLWLIIQHARSHGQWAGWGIFIVAALRCIESIALYYMALHCFALHCIISKHILGAFIEAALTEKRCHATRWNTALSLPLLWWAAVGHGWPVSGGSCILCWRRFTIESKCWKKHILNLDEYEMKHKRERWWCDQCSGVRCGDGNFGIFDLQSRVKAVRRLQLGIL